MDEPPDVDTLVAGLLAESESARKYAVFKLKSLLGDPSFADAFIQADGLPPLRQAVLDTNGNTQAYALGSLDALLELDMGWECCDEEVLEKVRAMLLCLICVRDDLTLMTITGYLSGHLPPAREHRPKCAYPPRPCRLETSGS